MNVLKIITEEIISFINESFENEKDVYDLYEVMDDVKYNLINDFLYNNNSTFTKKINWTVVPFEKLRRVWNDYMRFGKVQNTKLLDDIERKIIRNAFLLNALTEIYGHTMSIPEEFNELIENYVTNQINCFENEKTKNQYKINWENPSKPQINNQNCFGGLNPTIKSLIEEHDDLSMNEIKLMLVKYLKDKFYDNYGIDKNGEPIISDNGLEPILILVNDLYFENNPENKLQLIDKILNVVHQRTDLAAWFIQGGSSSLSKLSGY